MAASTELDPDGSPGRAAIAWSFAGLAGALGFLIFPPIGLAIAIATALYTRRYGLREPYRVSLVIALLCTVWSVAVFGVALFD